MERNLTQLAAWILPPIALPISLLSALSTVTEGGALEAAVIRSGVSKPVASIAGLVGTLAAIEAAPAATRIAKGLALCNKGRQ
jgi:hypothetical protein